MQKLFFSFLMLVIISFFSCQQKNKAVTEGGKKSTVAPQPKTNVAPSANGEWTVLFDGVSGAHWKGYNEEGFPDVGWTVTNGALTLLEKSKGGTIITNEQYENFDLELEFKLEKGANSGILYLIQELEGKPAYYSAPEYQLIDDAHTIEISKGDASVTKHHLTADNYDLQSAPATKKLNPAGQWNKARVVIKNKKVEHYLNGEKMVEYTLHSSEWKEMVTNSKFAEWPYGDSTKGHIGLQDHGNMVSFRNIRIKRL